VRVDDQHVLVVDEDGAVAAHRQVVGADRVIDAGADLVEGKSLAFVVRSRRSLLGGGDGRDRGRGSGQELR